MHPAQELNTKEEEAGLYSMLAGDEYYGIWDRRWDSRGVWVHILCGSIIQVSVGVAFGAGVAVSPWLPTKELVLCLCVMFRASLSLWCTVLEEHSSCFSLAYGRCALPCNAPAQQFPLSINNRCVHWLRNAMAYSRTPSRRNDF